MTPSTCSPRCPPERPWEFAGGSYGPTGTTSTTLFIRNAAQLLLASVTSNSPGTISYDSGILYRDTLYSGQILGSGQQLKSADGRFTAVMQSDGQFVIYDPWGSRWASNTYGFNGANLQLQTDGNLVLYSFNPTTARWYTATTTGNFLTMQSDGNLVLYNSASQWLWQSGTRDSIYR